MGVCTLFEQVNCHETAAKKIVGVGLSQDRIRIIKKKYRAVKATHSHTAIHDKKHVGADIGEPRSTRTADALTHTLTRKTHTAAHADHSRARGKFRLAQS